MEKPNPELTAKFFKNRARSVDNIIKLAKYVYENASFENKRLLSTDYFIKIVKTISTQLNMSNEQIQSVQYKLYDVIKAYRIRGGQTVKVASLKDPLQIRNLVRELWFETKSRAVRPRPYIHDKMILRRMTAIQTLLVSVTGRRWIDLTRLRWEYAKIIHLKHATVIKIGIFISKPNKKGRRNESITLVRDFTDLCPVKLLVQYWILLGKPKMGWIFPCIHKTKKFIVNTFCPEWSAWCCTGHKMGKKTVECLGQVNGDTTERKLKRTARNLGFNFPPTKHTFRRILVVMATKLGMSRERICEHFGWKYDSHMISHYLQDVLGTEQNGLPCQIARNMLNKDLFSDILTKD